MSLPVRIRGGGAYRTGIQGAHPDRRLDNGRRMPLVVRPFLCLGIAGGLGMFLQKGSVHHDRGIFDQQRFLQQAAI